MHTLTRMWDTRRLVEKAISLDTVAILQTKVSFRRVIYLR